MNGGFGEITPSERQQSGSGSTVSSWPIPAKIHKHRYLGKREQAAGSCNHDKDTPASTIRRAVSASAVRPSGNFFRSGFQLGKIAEMRQRVGLRVP